METKTSEILLDINVPAIAEQFDFFQLQTSEKYIKKGAASLDLDGKLTAESITFSYGRSAFAMFRKGAIKTHELQSIVSDPAISVSKANPFDPKFKLFAIRLLMNALSNSKYKDFSFNNVTGHLFFYLPEWVGKTSIKALDVAVTPVGDGFKLDFSACTFTDVKRFKKEPDSRYPKYEISVNGTLTRAFGKADGDKSRLFVKKTPGSKKTEIPFFNFFAPKMTGTRVSAIYCILHAFNERYQGLCQIQFKTRVIKEKLTVRRDEDFIDKAKARLAQRTINVVNFDLSPEDASILDAFIRRLRQAIPDTTVIRGNSFIKEGLNVAFIHNENYYKENDITDPYKTFQRNLVIQCVTAEDGASAENEVVLNTIIKELVIKDDIINSRRITLDRWGDFGFNGSVSFGILEDDTPRFLEVLPDGEIKTIRPLGVFNHFKEPFYAHLKELLLRSKKNGAVIIRDANGSIMLVENTGINTLPCPEALLSTNPRRKSEKEKLIAGLIDINLYQEGESLLYNVGPSGQGLNISMPRGSLLYQVHTIEGSSFIEKLLSSMSVLFVKYNAFTVMPYPVKYLREWCEMEKRGDKNGK